MQWTGTDTIDFHIVPQTPNGVMGKELKQLGGHKVNQHKRKPRGQLFPSKLQQGYPKNEQIVKG